MTENKYGTIRLPEELLKEVDEQLIDKHGFKSRAEVAKEGIRLILGAYREAAD